MLLLIVLHLALMGRHKSTTASGTGTKMFIEVVEQKHILFRAKDREKEEQRGQKKAP